MLANELKERRKRNREPKAPNDFSGRCKKNPGSPLSTLPPDVRRIIAHEIHKADKDTLNEKRVTFPICGSIRPRI